MQFVSRYGAATRVSAIIAPNGDEFELRRDLIEVTSISRPDTSWLYHDAHGHEHRWYLNGKPAESYSPQQQYETPTLIWIKDGEEWWEDSDEPHPVGHTECRVCGEHIEPQRKPDDTQMYVPGMTYYRINGRSVDHDEFYARAHVQWPFLFDGIKDT